MTPDAARESLYRRLYAVWPEWTPLIDLHQVSDAFVELWHLGRIESSKYGTRVNMRLAT